MCVDPGAFFSDKDMDLGLSERDSSDFPCPCLQQRYAALVDGRSRRKNIINKKHRFAFDPLEVDNRKCPLQVLMPICRLQRCLRGGAFNFDQMAFDQLDFFSLGQLSGQYRCLIKAPLFLFFRKKRNRNHAVHFPPQSLFSSQGLTRELGQCFSKHSKSTVFKKNDDILQTSRIRATGTMHRESRPFHHTLPAKMRLP